MTNQAVAQIGLPVVCKKCGAQSRVCPGTDYGGWFKSQIFTTWRLRWYCSEHYELGKEVDKKASQDITVRNLDPIWPIAEPNEKWEASEAEDVDGLEELLKLV